jgi:hypothetical protein
MKRKISTLIFTFWGISVFAQNSAGLTTRQNLPSWTYNQGTRPAAGTFGFYLGSTLDELSNFSTTNPLSYMNVRWYKTEALVFRGGLRLFNERTSLSAEGSNDPIIGSPESQLEKKSSESQYGLSLGVEKHLSPDNMIDIYIAGDLKGGFRRNLDYSLEKPFTGDEVEIRTSRGSFDYGFGVGLGFQAFIADLPLALGVEAGFQAYGSALQKGNVTQKVGAVTTEYQFEVDENLDGAIGDKYTSLSVSRFNLNSGLRFSLCYFFNR